MIRIFGYFTTDQDFKLYLIFYAKTRNDLNRQLESYVKSYNSDKHRNSKIITRGYKSHEGFFVCDPRGENNID